MGKRTDQLVPYQFKPGQSGNPGGPNSLPPDIRAARKYSNTEIERVIHKMLEMSVDDIEGIYLYNPEAKAMEALIASLLTKAIKKGDFQRAEWIFNRSGMKMKDDPTAAMQAVLNLLPKQDLLALAQKAMTRLGASTPAGEPIDVDAKNVTVGRNPAGG